MGKSGGRFQSTHPSRGATTAYRRNMGWICSFNPRTPRGVRRSRVPPQKLCWGFNPRTPRGVRPSRRHGRSTRRRFQSTHPSRGATIMRLSGWSTLLFQSTHPSRGATYTTTVLDRCGRRFNPRTPRGVRQPYITIYCVFGRFQSTHPSRGATANGPTKGTFCHVFMGVTRHKYDFSRRFVPRPSFGTVLPPIFYHAIFCSLHLRAHKEPLR